jgi:hypothetical protein
LDRLDHHRRERSAPPERELTPFGFVDRVMRAVPPITPFAPTRYSRDMLIVLIAMNALTFVDNTWRIVTGEPLINYFTFVMVAAQIHGMAHFRRIGSPWISIATAPFLFIGFVTMLEMLIRS